MTTLYCGINTGEIVCKHCAGYALQLAIINDPKRTQFAGAMDTYETMTDIDITLLKEALDTTTLCYCKN